MQRAIVDSKEQKFNLHQLLVDLEATTLPLLRMDKTIRDNSGINVLLKRLISDIKAHDKELADFYANRGKQQIEHERSERKRGNERATALIDQQLLDDYADMHALLKRWLVENGARLIIEAGRLHVTYDDKDLLTVVDIIKAAGQHLIAMSKLVPDIKDQVQKDWVGEHLYSVARHVGSTYLTSQQSTLATFGGQIGDDGLQASGGICAGLVFEWARQSYENGGTPDYPTYSSIKAQHKQADQHQIRANRTTIVPGQDKVKIANLDLEEYLNTLQSNHIYSLSTYAAGKNSGHAYGIRKNSPNDIEIFDPNYGYFFFRDTQAAAVWLGTLFQMYQATDFPAETLTTRVYTPANGQALKPNAYPFKHLADNNALKGNGDEYYQAFIKDFKNQTHYINHLSEDTYVVKKIDSIFSTIRHHSKLLRDTDYADLIAMLEAANKNNFTVQTSFSTIRNELRSLKTAQLGDFASKMPVLIANIKADRAKPRLRDAAKTELANKAILLEAEIPKRIAELSRLLLDTKNHKPVDPSLKAAIRALRKPNEDDDTDATVAPVDISPDTLRLKIKLLTRRQQALRESSFTTRLVASSKGQNNYSLAAAQSDFQHLFGIDDQALDTDNLASDYFTKAVSNNLAVQHQAVFANLKRLTDILEKVDEHLRHKDSNKIGLYELAEKRTIAAQRALIETYLNEIDELRSDILILDLAHLDQRLQSLQVSVLPDGLQLADLAGDQDRLIEEFKRSLTTKTANRNQFTTTELLWLNQIYRQLKQDTQGSLAAFLNNKLDDNSISPEQRKGIVNLLSKVTQLKHTLVDAIDPNGKLAKDDKVSKSDFIAAIKLAFAEIMPNWNPNSPSNIQFNRADYEQFIGLANLPDRLITAIDGLDNQTVFPEMRKKTKQYCRSDRSNFDRHRSSIPVLYKNAKRDLHKPNATPAELCDSTYIRNAIIQHPDNQREAQRRADEMKVFLDAILQSIHSKGWKKQSKYNFNDAPTGVRAMRQDLLLDPFKSSIAATPNHVKPYADLIHKLAQTAQTRENPCSFFRFCTGIKINTRTSETAALYSLCKKVSLNVKQDRDLLKGCDQELQTLRAAGLYPAVQAANLAAAARQAPVH